MNSNISEEIPYLNSNRENASISDVLEQIKKKSEEFSTSDASIKLFQNLSNPTNLTNPQIITSLGHYPNQNIYNINKLPLLKPNKLKFSNDYTKKLPRKSKSDINITTDLRPFSTIDPFNLNDYQKLIEKAQLEIISNKNKQRPKQKIILEKIDKNPMSNREAIISRNNQKSMNIPIHLSDMCEEKDKNIWEKLKEANMIAKNINKSKDIKTNFIKFNPKKDYIYKIKLIKLLQYNKNNKNERYHNYLFMKNAQLKSTNDTINKLQKSKDFLEKKYKDEYVAYIQFLLKEIENEKKIKYNLMNQINKKLYEVTKLEKYIEKINNKKKDLIKWLYLQIQVKEDLPYLPKYYEYIIEDNMPLNEVNKRGKGEYNITKDEYLRIMNYKGKNVYENANQFFKKIEDLEIKSLTILNTKLDVLDEEKQLNKEMNELKKQYIISTKEDENKFNNLFYQLKDAKKLNIQLQNKLNSIKNPKKIKKKGNEKIIVNKLASYAQIYSNFTFMNHLLKNNKPVSILYNFTLCLYFIISSYHFEEIKEFKLDVNIYNENDKLILDILDYAEQLLNFLLAKKKYYYSNDRLKKLYEMAKDEVDKKTKIEKILIQIKLRKQKEIENREKLKEKMNKQYYKPKRKIYYDYYKKQMNKKNQSFLEKSVKKETKFEDFLYDIYS